MPKKYRFLYVIIGLLFLAGFASAYMLYSNDQRYKSNIAVLTRHNESLESELNTTNAALQSTQEDLQSTRDQLSSAQNTISEHVQEFANLQSQLEARSAELDQTKEHLQTATNNLDINQEYRDRCYADLNEVRSECKAYQSAAKCPFYPKDIRYTSNSAVSSSIKNWLEDTRESITETKWDIIWSNSKTTYLKLTGEFLWPYIVYYDDPNIGTNPGVFDITNQCWLDLATEP